MDGWDGIRVWYRAPYSANNCTTLTVSERLTGNCKDYLIIFHRISFIDKMKSSIYEICWGTTWFWRIYIWTDICRAHKLERLIMRAIIRRNDLKHNDMEMWRKTICLLPFLWRVCSFFQMRYLAQLTSVRATKNIAECETSPAIAHFHFFGYFHWFGFHHKITFITKGRRPNEKNVFKRALPV